jgi:hypothetical protein
MGRPLAAVPAGPFGGGGGVRFMMLSNVKRRRIKQVPDADGAKRLADEMQASGSESLFVEVETSAHKSLTFLEHFSFLKYLDVGGHARDLDTIAALAGLRELCFLRVTASDFGFLAGLKDLRLFDMRFGGCKSFETLAVAANLIGLRLLRLPSLKSLGFVGSMPRLQLLEVDSCKGIAALPDLSPNPDLRKLVLETMNGLTSLEGIETAQQLEYLVVSGEAKALQPEEFRRVSRCPLLRVRVGLGNPAPYRRALACVPQERRLTEDADFSFRGYEQPAESAAAPDRSGS